MKGHRIADEAKLRSYYNRRLESLAQRMLDAAEEFFSKESTAQRREFEDHIEERLQNGAKFIPRKKQSR